MDRTDIAEVNSWNYRQRDGIVFEDLAAEGWGGVIIKASQGTDWTFAKLPDTIRCAKSAGLLVGVLHYAEPGRNDAESEASHLMDSLSDDDLPLGAWCELDDLGGVPGFELGAWVETFTQHAMTPTCRPAILASAELFSQMAGAPWRARWIATTKGEGSTVPWGERGTPVELRHGDWEPVTVATYRLTSERGLNRPETGSRAVRPALGAGSPENGAEWESEALAKLDQAAGDGDEPPVE